MPTKLPIWDKRMLELMDYCITNKVKCTNKNEWAELVKIHHTGINQIKSGKSSFRHEHILNAAKLFNRNINWIYGLSEVEMLQPDKADPFAIIETQLKLIKSKVKKK